MQPWQSPSFIRHAALLLYSTDRPATLLEPSVQTSTVIESAVSHSTGELGWEMVLLKPSVQTSTVIESATDGTEVQQLQYHTARYIKPHGKAKTVSHSTGQLGREMILFSGVVRLQGTDISLTTVSHHTLPCHWVPPSHTASLTAENYTADADDKSTSVWPNNLPIIITWQWNGSKSNPWPFDRQFRRSKHYIITRRY